MGQSEEAKIKYDSYKDPRFPVALLHQAFNILEGQGMENFRRFVNAVDMPQQDIGRILNKYLYRTDPKFKAKINKIILNIKEKTGVEFRP
jgi:hypothetical protein